MIPPLGRRLLLRGMATAAFAGAPPNDLALAQGDTCHHAARRHDGQCGAAVERRPGPHAGFIHVLHSEFAAPVAFNRGHCSDADSDALMNQVLEEFDEETQATLLRRLLASLVDQDVALLIAQGRNPRAPGPKVKGSVQAQSWVQDLTPISPD